MVAHMCDPSPGEVEASRSEVQVRLGLPSSLGYLRPCLKGPQTTKGLIIEKMCAPVLGFSGESQPKQLEHVCSPGSPVI